MALAYRDAAFFKASLMIRRQLRIGRTALALYGDSHRFAFGSRLSLEYLPQLMILKAKTFVLLQQLFHLLLQSAELGMEYSHSIIQFIHLNKNISLLQVPTPELQA